MSPPLTRRPIRSSHSRSECPDCHGEGAIEALRTDPEGHSPRRVRATYECVECAGTGYVDVDPLEDVVAGEPLTEPDAVPESELARWARLVVLLGGDEAAAIDAARVLREKAA